MLPKPKHFSIRLLRQKMGIPQSASWPSQRTAQSTQIGSATSDTVQLDTQRQHARSANASF
jgi:hypothetical protein